MSPETLRRPLVGVLAVQGAFAEHEDALHRAGADVRQVRTAAGLEGLDALVIPGGESTTLRRVAGDSGLIDAIRAVVAGGLPTLGTCAGLIALSDRIDDGDPPLVGGLDVSVRRNGYGRQLASFEAPVAVTGLGDDADPMPGVFIRAPRITRVGPGVRVVATCAGEPVAVAQGDIMGAAFHPELTDDHRLHAWLADRARARRAEANNETRGEGRRVGTQ